MDEFNRGTDDEFRGKVRQFLADHYPPELRNPIRRLKLREIREWQITLSRKGWIAPNWPVEFGGMGLTPRRLLILIEEQERWGVAQTPDMGITMVGPLLIQHGTRDQQEEYLPKIIKAENIWCQGYSEPNAGSDLASLRTEARVSDDHFVVTGQKIWTTLADDATHMFLLVRTARGERKHEGISFLLTPMSAPGITVKPIVNIAGQAEFCEVFLDNVRVPMRNLVGPLHGGWTIAKSLLGFERLFVGSPKYARHALTHLHQVAVELGIGDTPRYRERYAELILDVLDLETMYARFAQIVTSGKALGPQVSLLKICATECFQKITNCMMELSAEYASIAPSHNALQAQATDVLSSFYRSIPPAIYSGSNEIMRNSLARDVLGLATAR